jgi:UDP-glucose 4-epimerase
MTYKDKNVLITGGAGFIGSNLAHSLVALGANVTILDNFFEGSGSNRSNLVNLHDEILLVEGSVNDKNLIQNLVIDQDYIFNLAAFTSHTGSMKHPRLDFSINAGAQLTMMEVCKSLNPNVKVVFTSTRQLYGKSQYLPFDEKHPIRPVDANGVSKLAGEGYHLLYNDAYGVTTCILRLTNTFGPRMRITDAKQTFVGYWINRVIQDLPFQVYGDGSQIRDFTYVEDCVSAILLAGLSKKTNGKIYNLSGPEVLSLNDVAEFLKQIGAKCGLNVEYQHTPFPTGRKLIDIGDGFSDSSLFFRDTGWTPKTTMYDGMHETLKFYIANAPKYLNHE